MRFDPIRSGASGAQAELEFPEGKRRWSEGLRRHEAIGSLIERHPRLLKAADVKDVAWDLGVSQATLYRLITTYRTRGTVEALMPRTSGRPAGLRLLDKKVEALIAKCIREIYLTPNKPTLKRLTDEVHAKCAAAGLALPDRRTIRARVKAIPERTRALRRSDTRGIKATTPTPGKLVATRPLEFVQIDHTEVDVVVVDEENRRPLPGRPWLTLAIDVFSRMVTGFHLSMSEPSRLSLGLCMLRSTFDKTAWLCEHGVTEEWPTSGLPERIGVDNGSDFRARQPISESDRVWRVGVDSLGALRVVSLGMIDEDSLRRLEARQAAILPELDERRRRLFAAAEARAAGHGGIAAVSRVTGVAASTIGRGLKDLDAPPGLIFDRVRRPGGGRKPLIETDPALLADLNGLIEPDARGDPMSPLRWTCKSLRRLAGELRELGHKISHTVVGELLKAQKFSLQANSKTREGADNPDRDAQFGFINQAVKTAMADNQPVISVDTKKKELVGDFKNAGREWRPQGDPEEVRAHDFLIKELGRAVPYGIYDLASNTGWVSVGMDNDTAAFAVNTIRRWWREVGQIRYPLARRLVVTADGGGSNGSRVRLWKLELQRLADELGLSVEVHHFPPGTSKWNKIEHRLFSFITQNWRAKPLVSYRVIVELIGATTTSTGLTVHCELDKNVYPKGVLVSDEQMESLNITREDFHGEWNYTIAPSTGRIFKAVTS